jgi:diguanylate cyclase (GGDEF)-like protein
MLFISSESMTNTEYYLSSIEQLLIVVQKLCLARTLEEITKIVLAAVRDLTNSDGATFVLLDNDFSYYVDENAIAPFWKGQRFPVNIDISGGVLLNTKPSIIEDIYNDERINRDVYKNTFVKSMIMIPVCTTKPIGAIGTYWLQKHQGTTEELNVLQLLANHGATAIENIHIYSQLERQLQSRTNALKIAETRLQEEIQKSKAMEAEIRRLSLTDELTGLHNRRGFFLLAEQQLRLAMRSQIHTSLMFFEINKLAEIKENFGDEIADDSIIAIARLLKRSFRSSDTLGRINEDEFVVLIQGNDLTSDIIDNRIKANVIQFNQSRYLPFTVTLNIGIQLYDFKPNTSLENLITLAHIDSYKRQIIG